MHGLYLYSHRGHIRSRAVYSGVCLHEQRYITQYSDNYYRSNFPTDSDFEPCSYGKNDQYPFVYFPDINDPSIVDCDVNAEDLRNHVPIRIIIRSSM